MIHLNRLKWPVVLVILLSTVLSCAETRRWAAPTHLLKVWSSPEQDIKLAEEHRTSGEYQEALDIYTAAYRKHPRDKALRASYVKSITQMVSTADTALARRNFAAAGRTYAILLENKGRFEGFARNLPFDNAELEQKLDDCKRALFRGGFQEYRAGNLDAAIGMWQGLLVIDPDNTEIKEALRTAKLQQKTLHEHK